jgi:AcrR family transcriptional regulator
MSVQDRPLRADAERNRKRLLDAARTLFAERGLDVSMDDIAHAAGVGVGTVYRRFRSRDEIIDALFDERLEEMQARARAAEEDPDPWQALVEFFTASLRAQAQDRGFKQLLFSSDEGRAKVKRMRGHVVPVMERVIERAKAAGQLRQDVDVVDFTVLSFMIGAAVDFTAPVDDTVWERYAALLFDALRPGNTSPLPRAALGAEELDAAMQCWRPPKSRS